MRRILFFIFCLFHLSAIAQSVAYYTGEKIDKKSGEFYFMDFDSTRLYVFRKIDGASWRREYRLETYNRDSLKLLSSIKIPYPDIDSVKFELQNIFIHPDYYQVVYSYFDSKRKEEKVNLINFSRSGVKVGETKTIDSSTGRNARKAGYNSVFGWKRSNQILSYNAKFINDTVYINIDHFSYDGNKLRSQNFKYGKEFGYYLYGTIDSSGNLFYVTKIKEKENHKDEDPFFPTVDTLDTGVKRSVRMYTPESDTSVVLPLQAISPNQYLLSDRYYSFRDNDGIFNLICTYSQTVDRESADGIYLVRIDTKSQTLLGEKFIPFYCSDNNLGPNKKGFTMPYCTITDILDRPGNGMEIVFENRHAVTESMYGIDIVTTYETGSIFSVLVDSNYVVTRMCRIKKQQYVTGKNEAYTRFTLLHDSTRCFYIYNELPENLNLSPNADIKKVKDSKVDETSIILTATENSKIIEQKMLINKTAPKQIDAILLDSSMDIEGKELFALRRIGKEDYLIKFYLK